MLRERAAVLARAGEKLAAAMEKLVKIEAGDLRGLGPLAPQRR